MKSTFLKTIIKPKVIIPVVAIVAIVVGASIYHLVGKAPQVMLGANTSPSASSQVAAVNPSTNLAFPVGGRVATVSVALGDHVTKGETLATLDGGTELGALNQAKGALELAQTQYGSLNLQYQNTKTQQDQLVANAYQALLSTGLQARAIGGDQGHVPVITGTYNCDKEGSYDITPYQSGTLSGYSFTFSGLESGFGTADYNNSSPFGSCGLSIQFSPGFNQDARWEIDIPNTQSSSYTADLNAYNLAVANSNQALSQLAANTGQNGSSAANVAQAAVDSAQGAYQAALAAYDNTIITAPVSGTVSFVSSDLKVGQSVNPSESVISITQ